MAEGDDADDCDDVADELAGEEVVAEELEPLAVTKTEDVEADDDDEPWSGTDDIGLLVIVNSGLAFPESPMTSPEFSHNETKAK